MTRVCLLCCLTVAWISCKFGDGGPAAPAVDLAAAADMGTPEDLAVAMDLGEPNDLVEPEDLSEPPDLAEPPDLSEPPDLLNPLRRGLIGYWPLDGNGDDLSGGGRPLTIVGGPGFAAGIAGQALELKGNGAQHAIRPMDDDVFDFQGRDFTLQIWVYYHQVAPEQLAVEKFQGATGPGWTLTKLGGNSLHFWSSGSITSSAQTMRAATWYHYLVRRSGATVAIWLDARQVVSGGVGAIPDTTRPLLVGRRNDADGRVFPMDGRLDELAIWDRALSSAEIAALYNGGAGVPLR